MFYGPRALITLLILTAFAGLAAVACDGGGDNGDDPTATAIVDETDEPDGAEAPSARGDEDVITAHIEGDFIAPDSHSFTQRFELAGLSGEQSVVIIGDDAWIREGSGDWTKTTAGDPAVLDTLDLTSADTDFFDSSELATDLAGLDSEVEEINGVMARRYFIPAGAVDTLVELFGGEFLDDAGGLESFEMTVWLHEENDALIRAEFVALAGQELLGDATIVLGEGGLVRVAMVIDRSRINDDSIVIGAPDGSDASPGEGTGDQPFQSYHYTVDLEINIISE